MATDENVRFIGGRVASGRGVARQHIEGNITELRSITGEDLFPGSLNLVLSNPVKFKSCFAKYFDCKTRMLWPGWINGIGNVWLYRWRGCPLHVVEVLSNVNLRENLNLVDGDLLTINTTNLFCINLTVLDRLSYILLWHYRCEWYYSKGWYVDFWLVNYARRNLGFKQS